MELKPEFVLVWESIALSEGLGTLIERQYFSHSLCGVFFQEMMGLCSGVRFLVGVLKG